MEQLLIKKSQASITQWGEINFVHDKVLHKLEQLGNILVPQSISGAKSDEAVVSNMLLQYRVMRLFDIILKCKLMQVETGHKSTSSLLYLVDNIFTLHDVFVGTPIATRIVSRAKGVLNFVAKRSDVSEEQDDEIKEMLSISSLKGSEFFTNVSSN